MIMKNYVADELANKVYHLTQALNQAKDIIHNLEVQNEILTAALATINSEVEQPASEQFSGYYV